MPFTLNNKNLAQNSGSAGSITVVVTGVLSGDLVVLLTGNDQSIDTMSVSDGTSSLTPGNLVSTGAVRMQFFYLLASVASGSVTYTVTYGAPGTATERLAAVYVFTPSAPCVFDVQDTGGLAASGTAMASGNFTTTGTDELVFGGGYDENAATFLTWLVNGIAATDHQSGGAGSIWYLAESTPALQSVSATINASSRSACNGISFKISITAVPNLPGSKISSAQVEAGNW